MSAGALAGLEPRLLWSHFEELTRIARPSKEEEAARAHVLSWARERGLGSDVDEVGNVVVRVPATTGREGAPVVVLQAHLDMVCERDPESPYDPRAGRINLQREGDWVLADGTTLGADNGIGVAAALAAAEDADVPHGPLELLLTVSEEQGLDGAKALDPGLVAGRLLVNLDGTSDDAITVGCAGSAHTFVRLPLRPEAPPEGWVSLEVSLSGAKGGHSGGDIARGRANAIKVLGRTLSSAHEPSGFRLALLQGGVSRNAIPREANAVVTLDPAAVPVFRLVAGDALAALRERYATSDEGLELSVEPAELSRASSPAETSAALALVVALPSGVLGMTPDVPGAVETSTSLNVATTDGGVLTLASMTRSSSPAALDDAIAASMAVARLARAEIEVVRSYPPWRPDLGSSLLATTRATFLRLFDAEPRLEVVHGGLECAVIGGRLPGVEMIAIGPEIVGPHAPGERLSIPATRASTSCSRPCWATSPRSRQPASLLQGTPAAAPSETVGVQHDDPPALQPHRPALLVLAQHPVHRRARGTRHRREVLLRQWHDRRSVTLPVRPGELADAPSHPRLGVHEVRLHDPVARPAQLLGEQAEQDVLHTGVASLEAREVVSVDGARLTVLERRHRRAAALVRGEQRELAERVPGPDDVQQHVVPDRGRDANGEAAADDEVERLREIVPVEHDLPLPERAPACDREELADVVRRQTLEQWRLHGGSVRHDRDTRNVATKNDRRADSS